jgi:hypothetical protein
MSLCCGLLLASSMAECFCICKQKLSLQVGAFHWPLPTVGSWWSQWGSCGR